MVDYQKNTTDCLSNVFGLKNRSPIAPTWLSSIWGAEGRPPKAVCLLPEIWSENKRKISITIDFAPQEFMEEGQRAKMTVLVFWKASAESFLEIYLFNNLTSYGYGNVLKIEQQKIRVNFPSPYSVLCPWVNQIMMTPKCDMTVSQTFTTRRKLQSTT